MKRTIEIIDILDTIDWDGKPGSKIPILRVIGMVLGKNKKHRTLEIAYMVDINDVTNSKFQKCISIPLGAIVKRTRLYARKKDL